MVIKEEGNGVISMLKDKRLSMKAKGLLCYLCKCPEIVDVGLGTIVADMHDGEVAVKAAIKEAEAAGYLKVERKRREDGKLGTYSFTVRV